MGFKAAEVNIAAGEDELDEERMTYSRDGRKEPGFATSMVPTLEEKMVAEHMPPKAETNGAPILDNQPGETNSDNQETTAEGNEDPKVKGEPPKTQSGNGHALNGAPPDAPTDSSETESQGSTPEAREDNGDLYGAPADASRSAKTDDQPPHARSGIDDADEQERAAPNARVILRKTLTSKFGSKLWTLPTPTPQVDPDGFEDPISNEFWSNVWVACAVHNVCGLSL
jgi:phospholipase D1/2